MNESVKMTAALVLVCVISSLLLSGIYSQTHPVIVENQEENLRDAIFQVQPNADSIKPTGRGEGSIQEIYLVEGEGGSQVGYAVLIQFNGFQGAVRAVYGLDNEYRITGVKVLEHSETPGLGSKITREEFLRQFKGEGEDMQVDAITGATISSKALINAVRLSLSEVKEVTG